MDSPLRSQLAPHAPPQRIRAAVAVPPVFDFYFTPHRFSVLGARIVGKLLEPLCDNVALYNFPLMRPKGAQLPIPAELKHLHPFLIAQESGPLSFFTRFQRFGPPIEECARLIATSEPSHCFISCFAFCYATATLQLASELKKLLPHCRVVVGGAGVCAYPDYFMRSPAVDFALCGEAESGLESLVMAFDKGDDVLSQLPNLWFRTQLGTIHPPQHTSRPSADEIMVAAGQTQESAQRRVVALSLSRGCPRKCRFCSNALSHGTTLRTASPRAINQALQTIGCDDNQPLHCILEDDNLLFNPPLLLQTLDAVSSRCPQAEFQLENGIDYHLLTPSLLDELIKRRVRHFNLSLVSIDAVQSSNEQRVLNLRAYESVIAQLQHHSIPSTTYFICGLKGDTRQSVVSTLLYLAAQPTLCGISLFYPVPGLADFENRTQFDAVAPGLCCGSAAWPWNGSLDTQSLLTAFRLSRLINLEKSPHRSDSDELLLRKVWSEKRLYTRIRQERTTRTVAVENIDTEMVDLFFSQAPQRSFLS
jgi:hypothetical protein